LSGDSINENHEEKKPKKILIDPGHGGYDPGAVGKMSKYNYEEDTMKIEEVKESDLALSYALEVKGYIEHYLGYEVVMTRTDDTAINVDDRWSLGKNEGVDAVISIHFNYSHNTSAQGTEVLYHKERPEDIKFAETMLKYAVEYLGTENRGVRDDSSSQHSYLGILKFPTGLQYPRALIEIEFISNLEAISRLGVEPVDKILDFAEGVVKGLKEYFGDDFVN